MRARDRTVVISLRSNNGGRGRTSYLKWLREENALCLEWLQGEHSFHNKQNWRSPLAAFRVESNFILATTLVRMAIKENVNLSRFSNYKIGGPARFFFEASSEGDVIEAVAFGREKELDIFILGGGTNLLIDDAGFNGLVIKPGINLLEVRGEKISVGAGVSITELLNYTIAHSLSGLEWAGGLPGTLGGAIRGNAGCFGGEMKDVIESVRSLDTKTMKMIERPVAECEFNYRDSIFKKKNGGEIILSAVLHLRKGNKKEIEQSIQEKIDYRKKNHPLEYPNIGSIFKNVPLARIHKEGSEEHKKALAALTLEFKGSKFSVKTDPFAVISAAKLISESGLRGKGAGGAMISEKHPNFIVNVKNAGGRDVKKLLELAKAEVYKKFGIKLEEEVQIL